MACVGSHQHVQRQHIVVNVYPFIVLCANGIVKYFPVKKFVEISQFT